MKTEYRSTVWSGKKRFQLFAICFILICHWGEKTDRRTKKRKSDWHDQHLNERNLWFFVSIVWKHWLWNKMCLHLCWENCIRHSPNSKHSSKLEISHIWMWKIEETFHDGEHFLTELTVCLDHFHIFFHQSHKNPTRNNNKQLQNRVAHEIFIRKVSE